MNLSINIKLLHPPLTLIIVHYYQLRLQSPFIQFLLTVFMEVDGIPGVPTEGALTITLLSTGDDVVSEENILGGATIRS